jgi:serine/threonine-protein kinase
MNPGMKLGPFVIEKEVGSGAMGTVYRAQYKDLKRPVAIKVMIPGTGSSQTAQARFQREAEILKQLRHPNIVRLIAVGRFNKSQFYAMEFIEGESLDRRLIRRGRLSWEEIVELGQQLCAALQYAHDQGIIHRDLKPSNLMALDDGTVKLTDFGIAKDMDLEGLTATNCTVGTASYMSPEQCKGDRNLSPRSDLYSLGVVFYELLTGRKPFQTDSIMEMFESHAKKIPPRPSKFVEDIPVWLDNLIMQLLEKKPDDRPVNAAKVAESLRDILEKVNVQQSAALDRVQARAIDRSKSPRLDEDDKEAARALLGKKKKKKKKPPVYQRGWFVALAVGVVVVAVSSLLWYVFLVPPSLESLHRQTAELMEAGGYENWKAAEEGPLATFQHHYADTRGKLADDLRGWADEASSSLAENVFNHKRRMDMPLDDKGEAVIKKALDEEEWGNLPGALERLRKLAKQKGDPDPDKHSWGVLAHKYANHLLQLSKQMESLSEKVQYDRRKEFKGQTPEEELAVTAFRAEFAKNATAARESWEELQKVTRDKADLRDWHIYAAFQVRRLIERLNEDKRNAEKKQPPA